jgi:tetratricopeptide (TPR) repeat protein
MQPGTLADAVRPPGEAAAATSDSRDAQDLADLLRRAANLAALKRPDEAIVHYRQALALAPELAEAHVNLAILLAASHRADEAIAHYRRAIALKPDLVQAHFNLANALQAAGRPAEAVASYENALRLEPDFAEAQNNLGLALEALGRHEEAKRLYEAALAVRPDFVEMHNNLGNVLRALGRHEEAIAHLSRALALAPGYAPAHNNLGNALSALRRRDEAITHYSRALAADPNLAETHSNLGILLAQREGPARAIPHYVRALALRPGFAEAYGNLANALYALRRPHEAIAYYEKAIALKPDQAEAHDGLGNALQAIGELEAAYGAFATAVRHAPRNAEFHLSLAHAKPFTPGDPRLADLEKLARDLPALDENGQIALNFALAKAYADLDRYEESFAHLRDGNALKRRTVTYDEAETLGSFERIRKVFSAALMQEKRDGGEASDVPVFVVGMPRSGTSLIEQILASHSAVHGAGQLTEFRAAVRGLEATGSPQYPEGVPGMSGDDLRRLGATYLRRVRPAAPAAQRIVDRMPANFFYAGLIHLALPQARIIHARRNPVDTCLSCFSLLFTGEQPHTYDLAELGRYHAAYAMLMDHWREVLPAGVMLEVQYEDVVDDPDGQARRIIAHCGLAWEDACRSFHQTRRPASIASAAPVRHPIYRGSVGRWRTYGDLLRPLIDALDAGRPAEGVS